MARRQTKGQKDTVERVMHEFGHGELDGRDGKPVKSRKQAIGIALSEAGASNQKTPTENRHALRHTKANERVGRTARDAAEGSGPSKATLYAEAKRRDIKGRSTMTKADLERALA